MVWLYSALPKGSTIKDFFSRQQSYGVMIWLRGLWHNQQNNASVDSQFYDIIGRWWKLGDRV
jgi:hypothetical protein